jgi:hypothetical protein
MPCLASFLPSDAPLLPWPLPGLQAGVYRGRDGRDHREGARAGGGQGGRAADGQGRRRLCVRQHACHRLPAGQGRSGPEEDVRGVGGAHPGGERGGAGDGLHRDQGPPHGREGQGQEGQGAPARAHAEVARRPRESTKQQLSGFIHACIVLSSDVYLRSTTGLSPSSPLSPFPFPLEHNSRRATTAGTPTGGSRPSR